MDVIDDGKSFTIAVEGTPPPSGTNPLIYLAALAVLVGGAYYATKK